MILHPTTRPPIDGIQYAVTFTAPCPCGTDVDRHATVTTAGAHTSEPGVCECETVVNGGGLSDGGGKLVGQLHKGEAPADGNPLRPLTSPLDITERTS